MLRELVLRRAATTITIACVTVVVVSALAIAAPALRHRWSSRPASTNAAYVAGDRIDLPAAIHESSPLTLLIFTRAGCAACQAAKSALATLIAGLQDQPAVRTLMIVRAGSGPEERDYMREIGLDDGRLVTVDFKSLRLARVPAVVLVDRRGEVRYSLEGTPTAVDQNALIRIAESFGR